jgi:hypothetical protein
MFYICSMSSRPSSPQQTPSGEPGENRADQAAEDAQYYRRVLHDIIDKGSVLIGLVLEQAAAQVQAAQSGTSAAAPAPCIAPDLPLAFDRVTRAVRHTIALADKLARPVPAKPAADPAQAEHDRARKRIIREVEDARQRSPDGNIAPKLNDAVLDRLDDTLELADEDDHRSTAEIVADICLEIGFETPFGVNPARRPTPPHTRTGSDPPLLSDTS